MSDQAKRVPDPVFDSIGDAGKWQILLLLLISLSKFPVGWHQLSNIFLAPPIDKYCGNPGNTTDICSPDCKEVIYDRSVFEQTITMEWDLICDKKHFANYSQTIFMFGILVGNVSFGIWADKHGRRIPFLFSVVLQLVSGVLAAFSPWFWVFVFLRFLCAVATGGNMLTSFCLIMEIIGPSRREVLTGIIYQVPFNIGHALLSVVAYFIRDFRMYQFTLSIFSVLLLSYICLIPESPRWLMMAGRIDESVRILERAAVVNKRPKENVRPIVEEAARARAAKAEVKKAKFYDLLRTPKLRLYSLCIFYNWFTVGFNYFGVSQYIGKLGGSIFLNVAISAALGIPGVIMSVPACKYLGRKPTLVAANLIIGICMIAFIFVPAEQSQLQVALASMAVFGAATSFPTVYLYGGEVFPTVARNSGMGFASMLARIGAMTAAHASSFETFGIWVPPVIFASLGMLAALLTLLLPETKGEPLPETLEDAENYGKKT
ncbi:organic cation transporter protein-like [Episyrphus balteatus]|uniref:organic cation transporter protein-like n=1 Tax=Episyrphus balteatus TaxID=286459 RepID=UPI0024850881|nr:organic cation transporter protein-like [Episyrphus balteatus]